MKYTYLIGNGLDLSIGLKTSFIHFFKSYCQISDDNNDLLKKFKEEISRNVLLWSDFESQMGRFTEQIQPCGNLSLFDYIYCIEDFRNALVKYLLKEEERIDSNFVNKCAHVSARAIEYPFQFMRKGSRNSLEKYVSFYIDEVIEYNFIIFNYTHTFENFLSPYGYNVVNSHDDEPRHWMEEDNEDSVVIDKIGKVIHVHGELGEAILLGVNDYNQVINTDLIENENFKYSYVKPIANKMLGEQQDKEAKEVISESDIIFIYGMSLGESDKIWWQQIMEWLLSDIESDRKHFLVIFWYDSSMSRSNPLDNIKCQKKIVDRMLSFYSDIDSKKKEYILDHIFTSLNSDIFKLDFDPFTR